MLPYINREVKTALRWYDDFYKLTRQNKQCKLDSELCPFAFRIDSQYIPPFQFVTQVGGTLDLSMPTQWRVHRKDGFQIYNLDSLIPMLRVDAFANPDRVYITLGEALDNGSGWSAGDYEMRITTASGTYYSETMTVCGDVDTMNNCHYTIRWKSCGDVGSICYSYSQFQNIMNLSNDQAELVNPTPVINEDTEDDADGKKVQVKTRKEVQWTLEMTLMPWYMVDALTEIPLHSTVELRIPGQTEFDEIRDVSMEVVWDDNCKARVNMKFTADDATVSTGCCDGFLRPCMEPCITADGVWDIGLPAPTVGDVVLISHPATPARYATFYGVGDPADKDTYGFGNYSTCTNRLAAVTGSVPYFYASDEWLPVIYVTETIIEGEFTTFVGNNMPGYGLTFQYTEDGTTWVDLFGGWNDLLEIPDAQTGIRARLTGPDDCEVAVLTLSLDCCSEGNLVLSGAVTTPEMNATYTQSGSYDGKFNYRNAIGPKNVYWWAANSRWINSLNGVPKYASPDDTEFPCQASAWYPVTAADDELTSSEALRLCGGQVA